jgi:hypothetical protein
MKTLRIEGRDLNSGLDHLRTVVATIDHEILSLPADAHAKEKGGLASSWAELVELLALGPTPERRDCPVCGNSGLRAATRCGYCWTKLVPIASAADVV